MKEVREENRELTRMLTMLLHTSGPEEAETAVGGDETTQQELGQ